MNFPSCTTIPTHLPVLSYPPLPWQPPPPPKKRKQWQQKQSCHESCSVSQFTHYPNSSACKWSLQWTFGHWCESKPLALLYHQYWILPRMHLRYPVVALCHGDPAALEEQHWSIHLLQQFIAGVDDGVGQVKALYLGLVVAELVSLAPMSYQHLSVLLCCRS